MLCVAIHTVYLFVDPKNSHRKRVRSRPLELHSILKIDHKPNELSGGQRQRVAVARALVNRPAILLADEPTGNLDSVTSDEIMRLFEQLYRQGNTLIVVTHEDDIADHARRVVRLRDGAVESDTAVASPRLGALTEAELEAAEAAA